MPFLFASSERLDLDALAQTFDEAINDLKAKVQAEVERSHRESYDDWFARLHQTIHDNICDFNPDLRDYSEKLVYNERRIDRLTNDLERLEHCSRKVKDLLSWSER